MRVRAALRCIVGGGAIAAVLASPVAWAQGRNDPGRGPGNGPSQGRDRPRPHSVPEFDPAAIGAIAAVVVGGGVLLARRRKGH